MSPLGWKNAYPSSLLDEIILRSRRSRICKGETHLQLRHSTRLLQFFQCQVSPCLRRRVFKSRIPILTIVVNMRGNSDNSQRFHEFFIVCCTRALWLAVVHYCLPLLMLNRQLPIRGCCTRVRSRNIPAHPSSRHHADCCNLSCLGSMALGLVALSADN